MLGYITNSNAEGGLELGELPEPQPLPSDVIVDTRAYAVNRGELKLLEERLNGWQPGQDVAGVVAEGARDGSGPARATRVVGAADQGGWSQRVAIPAYRVAPIPDNVSFADAAALPVAGLTALRALRTGGQLLGRRVLVTGASGGVGSFAVQLALIAGAHVTALVSGPHRVAPLRALGANDVITALKGVNGRFDLVLDGIGGQTLVEALGRLSPGGSAVAYGMASGEQSRLTFFDLRSANARLSGFFVYDTNLQTFGDDLAFLAQLLGAGRMQVPGPRLDWKQTRPALDLLRHRKAAGKVVLTISD
jgi:NADPH:quinone reductase-like Zn-dependent oxidoreductase